MCINEDVMRDNDLEEVDTQCRAKTAPWVRQTIQSRPGSSSESSELCSYFETLDVSEPSVSPGIYGLDDLKALGRRKGLCPYFLTSNHSTIGCDCVQLSIHVRSESLVFGLESARARQCRSV